MQEKKQWTWYPLYSNRIKHIKSQATENSLGKTKDQIAYQTLEQREAKYFL